MEQPPFQQQPHPNMATWYPHQYQAQQQPPLQQHHRHPMPWPASPMAPSGDQSLSYSQPPAYHHPQGGYYPHPQQQVHHQYPAPPQSVQPQFTYMYGQQDQAWQAGNPNNWGYQQWSYPAQNNDLSQEEVWAAKARAWAASKAVQDEPKPASTTTPVYPDYGHQKRHGHTHPMEGQQHQESVGLPFYPTAASQDHNPHPRPAEHAVFRQNFEDSSILSPSLDAFDPKATLGPSGVDRLDQSGSLYTQSGTRLLSQSQASPLSSQPQLSYNEKMTLPASEHPQQQPIPPNYHPLPLHQPQQPPLQPHYQPPAVVEAHEGEFRLSPAALQNWAPAGGPGMPFPPIMGAGAPQFDSLYPHPHQMSVSLYGRPEAPQGLGFPGTGSFVGGVSPSLGSGPGTALRPLYATEGIHPERPKKAAVPSWLREEIMKKKAAALTANVSGTAPGMILSDESSQGNGGESTIPLNERHHVFDKLRRSSPGLSDDEEEDEEEEIEAARTDAINQEIKRLLTEVLLKVTGDLFEEIAQEVMDEDDDAIPDGEFTNGKSRAGHISVASDSGIASMSGRVLVTSLKVPVTADSDGSKESSESEAPQGDVLGLGNYASDEEDTQDSKELKNNEQAPSSGEVKVEQQEYMNVDISIQDQSMEHSGPTIADVTFQGSHVKYAVKNDVESDSKKVEVESWKQDTSKKEMLNKEDTSSLTKIIGSAQNGRIHVSGELSVHGEENSFKDKDAYADRRQSISEQAANMSTNESREDEWYETKSDTKLGLGQHHDGSGINKQSAYLRKLVNQSDEVHIKEKHKGETRNEKMKEKDSYVKEKKKEDTKDSKESKTERVLNLHLRDSSRDKRKDKVKEKDKYREKEYDRDRKKHDKRERDARPGRSEGVDKKIRHRSSSSSGADDSSSSSSDKSRRRMRTQRSRKEQYRNLSPPVEKSRNKRVSRSRSRSRSPHSKHMHRRNVPSHEKPRRNASRSPVHRRRHM